MYFTNPVLFEIPVRPRVQKFLRVHYPQAIVATPDSTGLPLYIWALAQNEKVRLFTSMYHTGRSHRRRLDPEQFTAYIGVGLHEFHGYRRQHLFNYAELMVLDAMAHRMIQQNFLGQMQTATAPTMQALRDWADRYDFSEEDLVELNLKQILMRHRRSQGQSPFTLTRPLLSTGYESKAA